MTVAKRTSKRAGKSRTTKRRFSGVVDAAPARFTREVYGELRRSHWPSQQETVRLTMIVLGVGLLLAAVLGTFDYGLSRLSAVIFE